MILWLVFLDSCLSCCCLTSFQAMKLIVKYVTSAYIIVRHVGM